MSPSRFTATVNRAVTSHTSTMSCRRTCSPVSAPARDVAGKFFNAATNHRITLNQTFEILKKLTGYSGTAKHGPERSGDVKHSLADISLAEKHLGYKPLVMFEEGLERTVQWYQASQTAAVVS